MLSQLYIENVAVIEKATIEFHKGFNILTGETGAGKSIIIDSMHGFWENAHPKIWFEMEQSLLLSADCLPI